MNAAVIWHPRLAEGCDRINALTAEANRAEERAEAIETCKRIIDDPRGYTDTQLREVCGFYLAYGNGGDHYLRADARIFAINRREFIARNCPQPETPADVFMSFRDKWDQVIVWGFVVAVAVWVGLGGLG